MASNSGGTSYALRGQNVPLSERMEMFDSLPGIVRDQLNYGLYEWTPESIFRLMQQQDPRHEQPEQMVRFLREFDHRTAMIDRVRVWDMTNPALFNIDLSMSGVSDEESIDWSD